MGIRPAKRVTPTTRSRAIGMRKRATKPEQLLWLALCGRKLDGLKFRRQHPIEPYIVDFYCPEANLIVELDGDSHDHREEYDAARAEFLTKLGLKIVRFANDDVIHNIDGVAEAILRVARQC